MVVATVDLQSLCYDNSVNVSRPDYQLHYYCIYFSLSTDHHELSKKSEQKVRSEMQNNLNTFLLYLIMLFIKSITSVYVCTRI